MPTKRFNQKGFTLVELLVVVTILAILATIGFTIFNGTQKTARDAKRKGDIDAIAQAMEVNYGKTTGGLYDSLKSSMFSSGKIPTDPINAGSNCSNKTCVYCYRQGNAAQTTGVCDAPNSNPIPATDPSKPDGGATTPFWIVCADLESPPTGGDAFYCRANQQ